MTPHDESYATLRALSQYAIMETSEMGADMERCPKFTPPRLGRSFKITQYLI